MHDQPPPDGLDARLRAGAAHFRPTTAPGDAGLRAVVAASHRRTRRRRGVVLAGAGAVVAGGAVLAAAQPGPRDAPTTELAQTSVEPTDRSPEASTTAPTADDRVRWTDEVCARFEQVTDQPSDVVGLLFAPPPSLEDLRISLDGELVVDLSSTSPPTVPPADPTRTDVVVLPEWVISLSVPPGFGEGTGSTGGSGSALFALVRTDGSDGPPLEIAIDHDGAGEPIVLAADRDVITEAAGPGGTIIQARVLDPAELCADEGSSLGQVQPDGTGRDLRPSVRRSRCAARVRSAPARRPGHAASHRRRRRRPTGSVHRAAAGRHRPGPPGRRRVRVHAAPEVKRDQLGARPPTAG